MSLLSKVRNRLAFSRKSMMDLRDITRDKKARAALADIISGLERMMDDADEKFADPRANASKTGWREKFDDQQSAD